MSNEPSSSASGSRSRWLLWLGAFVLFLAVLAGAALWWMRKPAPDMAKVFASNNRGIGYMEQFNYPEATAAFEEVVHEAPDWLPGRINLGISLLNTNTTESLQRARGLFEDVLKQDPDNLHAHYCLGIMLLYQKDSQEAIHHFEAVLAKDPHDASAWYFLGLVRPAGSDQATECFRKALALDPHLNGAIYGLAMNLRPTDPAKARQLLTEVEDLRIAAWQNLAAIAYTQMGRYAEVIGRDPASGPPPSGPLPLFERKQGLRIELAPGVRWATAADFGNDEVGQVRAQVRARFGATFVVLDYNHDDKPDLFLVGAVVEKGKVRNLLLRNDGDDRFTDVTAAAGLAEPHPTLGCCVADVDNDGYPDLVLTGVGSQRLFRNRQNGTFEDKTTHAGLHELKSVCLTAVCVDLDQDSDLDILIAEFAASPTEALKVLKGEKATSGSLAVYLNDAKAPPAIGGKKSPPLECHFHRDTKIPGLQGDPAAVVGLAVADIEGDRDLDFLVLSDRASPSLVLNDRLLRFRRKVLPERLAPAAAWNGALVLDVDHDGRSDVFMIAADRSPVLLLNRAAPQIEEVGAWFEPGVIKSPTLLQAQAIDIDLDGWTDVVGLSAQRLPVLLHNEGGKLIEAANALGLDSAWPRDLIALTVCDFSGHGFADLFVWSEAEGLQLYENRGNGHHSLKLEVSGRNAIDEKGGERIRCNTDGIGTWVIAQAGDDWTGLENTTLSAGLGQSRQPLLLGMRSHDKADVVRLRWTDGAWQAELNVMKGPLVRIEESNRKPTSCPILFTWNGQRFIFVTDFLGAGSMGELAHDGSTRPPRPEESVKIEADQLVPLQGEYVLKVAEPMDEATYLDRLQLLVVDHPAAARVYPDERFATADPQPTQNLIAFHQEIFPISARDHRGRDVTAKLRHWDRDTVDGFAKRAWIGFAEEHFVELDFGTRLASFKPNDRLILCLAGWTDYAYPESIYAAHQAGVEMQPPVLERQDESGHWQTIAETGFPAGLPRMMLLDVTGKLTGPRCRLRLRTNLHVYWDQIFVATGCETLSEKGEKSASGMRATPLEVRTATLAPCGIMQEFSPDGKEPTLYDHDRHVSLPLTRLTGSMTRYGEVTELLRQRDDRFVIFGPGDEVTVRFDARALPPLPQGSKRSFVLRSWGYCKDTAPFTATGATLAPLPFHKMSKYPYGADEHYPEDTLHLDYLKRFNTRQIQEESSPGRRRR
jgi:Flp pilus assembly protein TadD